MCFIISAGKLHPQHGCSQAAVGWMVDMLGDAGLNPV